MDVVREEFNSKVTSTWSSCDCEREMAFTHKQFGKDGKGWTTQLDYIIGPERTTDNAYIHNDVKNWDTWDFFPMYATMHEDDAQTYFPQKKKKKKWPGWRPVHDKIKN